MCDKMRKIQRFATMLIMHKTRTVRMIGSQTSLEKITSKRAINPSRMRKPSKEVK